MNCFYRKGETKIRPGLFVRGEYQGLDAKNSNAVNRNMVVVQTSAVLDKAILGKAVLGKS